MRYLKYFLFIVINCFVLNTFADSLDMKVSLNGDYSKQTWFANGRNNTLSIYSNYSENQKLYDISQAPQYGYVMMCSDAKITSSYSSNPNNITNIRIENTNIPCNQGTMHGTIQYVLFNTPEWSCSVQGQSCVFGYSLVFYQESSSNYYIMESQFVDSQISVDLSSGYLINQNNQIINQNQQIINQGQQTNDKLNDINGSINNDNVDDPSSSINSFKDKLATNGVITQLIGLPVTLFTKVLNSVNGTCSTYNLGSLFGTDLILPCVNIQNYLGTTLWSIIDVLISGLFVYSISRKFIKVFESMSSMNEGDVIGD